MPDGDVDVQYGPGSGVAKCDQKIQNSSIDGLQPMGQRVWQHLATTASSGETSGGEQNSFGLYMVA